MYMLIKINKIELQMHNNLFKTISNKTFKLDQNSNKPKAIMNDCN